MPPRLNQWRQLRFEDPAIALRGLYEAQVKLTVAAEAGIELDPLSLRLRTQGTRVALTWRDAALFTYGMTCLSGTPIYFALHEKEDYDFVTAWNQDNLTCYCPVQLKELPPEDLGPRATLASLVSSLDKYATESDTVLAIRLSKKPELDLVELRLPHTTFREVYMFWANSPDSATFIIYGDLKSEPRALQFDYPR